jgi:hypothetical protein
MARPRTFRAARPIVWNQRAGRAQESFLVRVENRDQRDFGQIEALRAAG